MSGRRIGKLYKSTIDKIAKRVNTSQRCMKRSTNNPDYIYMLGNKCIKADVKSRKNNRYTKISKKYMKKGRNQKSRRVKHNQRGGGLYGNVVNASNILTSGIREVLPPPSVLPWEGNFTRNFFKI